MKKLGIIGATIVILFAAIIILTNISKDSDSENKTAKSNGSSPVLVDVKTDKNYQNIVSPTDLKDKITSGEEVVAYFFSPECPHCLKMTPALMPIADEVGVHVDQYNILENEQGWDDYQIEATPTLIYFKDGEEVNRIVGDYSGNTDTIYDFLEQVK